MVEVENWINCDFLTEVIQICKLLRTISQVATSTSLNFSAEEVDFYRIIQIMLAWTTHRTESESMQIFLCLIRPSRTSCWSDYHLLLIWVDISMYTQCNFVGYFLSLSSILDCIVLMRNQNATGHFLCKQICNYLCSNNVFKHYLS